jgi:PAS domain S-box-containing protein
MALTDLSFFQDTFMPHGYCLMWQPDVLWLHVISDLLIATAYFSIPLALLIFVKKRKDLQFRRIFILFACFILLCGLTHLMSIYTMWHGAYALHGVLKALTALVSVMTAYVAFNSLDEAIAIPSRQEFELALEKAATETLKSEKLAIQKKSQDIFKLTTELMPSGLLVIDAQQAIVMVNEALCRIFGYQKDELIGKHLSCLISQDRGHHTQLVKNYLCSPDQDHRMAAGRVVQGLHKDGHLVELQISLSVYQYEGERHTFATVTDFGSFLFEQQRQNELNNRLIRALEASDDGAWEWNIQNNMVWYSAQFKAMTGCGQTENNTFEDWHNHIHPDDKPRVDKALELHFSEQQKYDILYRGLTGEGVYEWFRTRGNSIFDHNGKPILVSGILSNIHQTKMLEEKLADKSKFLNEVLQRSLTGLYIFDSQQQKNIYINPEFTKLTGYTLQDFEKITDPDGFLSLYHPEDRNLLKAHLRVLLSGAPDNGEGVEYRFKHKYGHWLWLYSRDSVYSYDEQGKPKELLGALFDITELKQREYQIRKLAIDYSTSFEHAGVGIAHIHDDYSLIKANPKFLSIFGYADSDIHELNLLMLCNKAEREHLEARLLALSHDNQPVSHVEKEFIRSDDMLFWAELSVSYVAAVNDDKAYFIVVVEDISQRKLMEQKLSESNQALERFAYSASHDLQEPLRKISAFSGSLEKRLKGRLDDPDIDFQLERICSASLRMSQMIDNLLKLSRATKASLSIKRVSLSGLLVQAIDDLSAKIDYQLMSLRLDKDVMLNVDPNAFSQVIRNLISNSICYKAPSRPLKIQVITAGSEQLVRIRYQDNGCGFTPDKAEVIFEPFRRLRPNESPGTGMGLTICRQIMKAHKGRIYASVEHTNGAEFILELPGGNPHE